MNNIEFKQHFINILLDVGIDDYKERMYIITPIQEKSGASLGALDDIMRLRIFPQTRTVSFESLLNLFSIKEGYYPCWIEITSIDNEIHMNTSLRMRKAGKLNGGKYYPFRIGDNSIVLRDTPLQNQ